MRHSLLLLATSLLSVTVARADLGSIIQSAADATPKTNCVLGPYTPSDGGGVISTPLALTNAADAGCVIQFGPGTFSITTTSANVIGSSTVGGIKFKGAGPGRTILVINGPATMNFPEFKISGANVTFEGFTIKFAAAGVAGNSSSCGANCTWYGGAFYGAAFGGRIINVELIDTYTGVQLTDANASNWVLRDVRMLTAGGIWRHAMRVGGMYDTTGNLIVGPVSVEHLLVDFRTASVTNYPVLVGSGVNYFTMSESHVISPVGTAPAIRVDNSNQGGGNVATSHNINFSRVVAENTNNYCATVDATNFVRFTQLDCRASNAGVQIAGGSHITIANSLFSYLQQRPVYITGGSHVHIDQNHVSNYSLGSCNTYSGVTVGAGISYFQVTHNHFGPSLPARAGDTTPCYGKNAVEVSTGASNHYIVAGNSAQELNAAIVSDGGSGTSKTVANNL